MSIDIDKLERKAKAATPGPWSKFDKNSVIAVLRAASDRPVINWTGFDRDGTPRKVHRANAAYISAANPAAVLELIGEVRRLRAELAAAQAHKFFCITELQRVNDLMLSEAGVGLVDQRVFELTDSCALDAAIKSATATQTSDWPTPEPLHLQAITFAYEKGFAAGLSGRNTENVFAETGGQRAAFDIGLWAGRRKLLQ